MAVFLGLPILSAKELNLWPLRVRQFDSPVGRPDHSGSLGPVISETQVGQTSILSIRPFWTTFDDARTGVRSDHLLYPFFNWTDDGDTRSGHVLNLIQYRRDEAADTRFFQIFPFVFSNQTQSADTSYFGIWPIGGVLKHRLFRDRITWAAWPLYVRTQRGDETRTHVPYPFVQILRGPHSRGFGIWPLYGHFERDNDYEHSWAAWPIHYHFRDDLDKDVPYVRFGVLPFYHLETAAGLKSETFGWPFFGYTREWEPRVPYSENRYLWPLLVQGRGEERHVNRWLPLFAHEKTPKKEKRWYLWPLLKTETFKQSRVVRDRTTLLYFLYRSERQSLGDTTARLTTIWPFAGYWDDGRGRKQLQMLDPFTVFFPNNKKVKEIWSPLFTLYRFDERMGNRRHSLLWDFIVWENEQDRLKSFYAGPIFEWESGKRWQFLRGLVRSVQENDQRYLRWLWKD